MPWPKPTVMVSNGPQREPGVSVRPRSLSSIATGSRKPIFFRNAFCRSVPTWSAICAVPMLELSFMISATEQTRPNGWVSWTTWP